MLSERYMACDVAKRSGVCIKVHVLGSNNSLRGLQQHVLMTPYLNTLRSLYGLPNSLFLFVSDELNKFSLSIIQTKCF